MSTVASTPLALADAYVRAWQDHDAAAVRGLFGESGSYLDPTLPGPITGAAIETHVAARIAAFPDLTVAAEHVPADRDRLMLRWRLRATWSGPLDGFGEPTGEACEITGIDGISVGPGGIEELVSHFDRQTLAERLGHRVVLLPPDSPALRFGTSVRTDLGSTAVPGALSMTWIDVASREDDEEVERRGAAVVEALAAEPGFIAWVGTSAGGRGHTFTAWVSAEAAEAAMARNRPHREAVKRFRTGALGRAGFTSLWVPHRLNAQHARCPDCGARVSAAPGDAGAVCPCGGSTPPRPFL